MAGTASRPAVEGWFAEGPDGARLIGGRCTACGTVVFPNRAAACPNPACAGSELVDTPLTSHGRVWSYTTNHYPPPEPYVAPDPFVPYTVLAVELAEERMVVLGQAAAGVSPDDLRIGTEVELVVEPLFTDADGEVTVYKWRPVGPRRHT